MKSEPKLNVFSFFPLVIPYFPPLICACKVRNLIGFFFFAKQLGVVLAPHRARGVFLNEKEL